MDFRTQGREIIQRPAAERRKARPEYEARVGEIGIGDDAFGDDGLRFLEIRSDQFLAQIVSRAACPAFARLAVFPEVNAAAFLAISASVPAPLTTSTSCNCGTGLKKWIPTRRDGFLKFAPMSASLRLEVFEARIASGFAAASSFANSSRLA